MNSVRILITCVRILSIYKKIFLTNVDMKDRLTRLTAERAASF